MVPLMSSKKIGTGINKEVGFTVTLNDNKIDYIHWDEIMNHLQLLEVSRQTGHSNGWLRQRDYIDYLRALPNLWL